MWIGLSSLGIDPGTDVEWRKEENCDITHSKHDRNVLNSICLYFSLFRATKCHLCFVHTVLFSMYSSISLLYSVALSACSHSVGSTEEV